MYLRSRQFFYVLAGRLTLELDGARHRLGPGEGLEVPPGAAHQALNDSNADVRFLVVSHLPGHGDRSPSPPDA